MNSEGRKPKKSLKIPAKQLMINGIKNFEKIKQQKSHNHFLV
jgi:hypothetical protein